MPNPLDPQPTGVWSEAIRHLRAAHELMAEMTIADRFAERTDRDQSLGSLFEREIEVMIGNVHQHYRRLYMEIATRPARLLIREDGTSAFINDDGTLEELTDV